MDKVVMENVSYEDPEICGLCTLESARGMPDTAAREAGDGDGLGLTKPSMSLATLASADMHSENRLLVCYGIV